MKKNTITCSPSFMFSPLVPLVHACPRLSVPVPAHSCPSPHVRARPRSSVPIPARSARCPSPYVRAHPRSSVPIPSRSGPSPLVRMRLRVNSFVRTCVCACLFMPAFAVVCTRLRSYSFARAAFVLVCTHLCLCVFVRACGHARSQVSI